MAQAEGAAEVGVLTYLYLALVSALMWACLRGLKAGWEHTLGQILEGLAGILKFDYWKIHIDWGGPVRALDHKVINALTVAAEGYESAMGFWFHSMAHLQLWIVDETWKLTRDLLHLGGWMIHTYVPAYVHGWGDVLHGTTRTIIKTQKVIVRQAGTVAKVLTPAQVFELQWLGKHWKALTKLVAAAGAIALFPPTAIPKIWHGIDDLRKWRVHVNRRLHRLEVLTGAVAFAGLMGNAMGINWRCLRPRGPIGKVARRLCGISATALEDLLGLIADVVIVADICEVIPYLEQGLNVIAGPLSDLIGEAGAALCGDDFDPPPDLAIPALSIPALVGATAVAV